MGSRRRAARAMAMAGYAAAGTYVGWNAYELLVGQHIPRSMFYAATGLPCPTTGGTRSLMALLRGDVAAAARWNPFSLVIAGLAVATVYRLAQGRIRPPHRWRLPSGYVPAWLILLGVAWLYQLFNFPRG